MQTAVSNLDDVDMNPVVRLAVETGIESLAAVDCSVQRKRKRQVVQMNGTIDDVSYVTKKNNGSSESCDESSKRKKRRKVASSKQSNIQQSLDVNTGEAVASQPTGVTASSESKSSLADEVEIWIPNKKYKGPLKDVYAELPKKSSSKVKHNSHEKNGNMPFMTFIPSDKTPAALVRRWNRLTQSEPKQLHKSVSFIFICNNVQL